MTPPKATNLDEANQLIASQYGTIVELEETTQKLQRQLAWLTRQLFGRKSEQFRQSQEPGLFAQTAEPEAPARPEGPPATQTIQYTRTRPGGKRLALPDYLPRKTEIFDLPEDQKVGMKKIGEEVTEQLECTAGEAWVRRKVQYKYARIEESLDGSLPNVVVAPKPDEGLPKCIAGPSLLAHIALSKYGDHLPLNRLEGILKRSGVQVSRASMCRWMQGVAELARPLTARMKELVLESHVIPADETTVKQLVPGRGSTRTCYFWSYLGDPEHPFVLYDYQQTRGSEGPTSWFTDAEGKPNYHGKLQCDGFSSYEILFDPRQAWRMTYTGCWAHVRRKFHEVRMQFPGPAHDALGQIRRLYEVEEQVQHLDDDARRELRQDQARPLVHRFFDWCQQRIASLLPRSGLAEAMQYPLNRTQALSEYLDDPKLAIDNNACERSLRGIALGRRNWLFTGSPAGGQAAATIFSLISSAKRNDVEPQAYLTDLITHLPASPRSRLDDFLPHLWKSRRGSG